MLKKACAIISVLILLVSAHASAWAAPGDAVLFQQMQNATNANRAESLAAVGDTLYLLSQSGLYAWKPGDAEPKLVTDKIIPQYMSGQWEELSKEDQERYQNSANFLFSYEAKLYGLNTMRGTLLQFDITADGVNVSEAAQLDWKDMFIKNADYSYTRQIFSAALLPGRLYLLVQQPNDSWNEYDLLTFDLNSGTYTKVSAPNVHSIAAYQNNQLLCNVYDWENMYTSNGERIYPALSVLDTATSALTKLTDFPTEQVGGLAFDAVSGMVYALGRGELYGYKPGGAFESVAYMPVDYPGDQLPAAVLAGGYYAAIPDYGSVFVRNTDPALKSDRVLRIAGGYSDEVTKAFQAVHSEIPVVFSENTSFSAEQIAQDMVSATSSADLYMLSLSYGGFSSLREKGYVSDLSGSAILTDAVSKMYPQFVQAIYKDGNLIAFPYQFYSNAMGYSPEVLKEIGIEQPPKTIAELIDLYVEWVENYSTEFGNYTLQENVYDIRRELINTALMGYFSHYARTGEELKFDTPLFKSLLEKIDEAMPVLEELNPSEGEQQGSTVVYSSDEPATPTSLFTSNLSINPQQYNDNRGYEPLLLALDEGMEPTCFAQIQVYVINPNSKNKDMALTYLEYLAQNMPKELAITLNPDINAPVETPEYAKMIENAKKQLEDLKAQLNTAKPEEQKMLEDNIKSLEGYISWQEANRYTISESTIAKYRSLVPYICVDTQNLDFLTSSPEATTLLQRFLQGEMNSQQFLKEFDRKLQMMRMESN